MKNRVNQIYDPVMQFYVVLTYIAGTDKILSINVRNKETVSRHMKSQAKQYNVPVEYEFAGFHNAKYAYDYKDHEQRNSQGLIVTDREHAKVFTKK